MFKSVAEMKRELTPGKKVVMTAHRLPGFLVGQVREVAEKTNSVTLRLHTVRPDGEKVVSGMDWPKKDEVRFTEKGWQILDKQGEVFMEYEVVE